MERNQAVDAHLGQPLDDLLHLASLRQGLDDRHLRPVRGHIEPLGDGRPHLPLAHPCDVRLEDRTAVVGQAQGLAVADPQHAGQVMPLVAVDHDLADPLEGGHEDVVPPGGQTGDHVLSR